MNLADQLQLTSIETAEEIVNAYRTLVKKYHPDNVANLGDEFAELAERRMKDINAAYEQLRAA